MNFTNRFLPSGIVVLPILLVAGTVQAHTGAGPAAGFPAGLAHPLLGIDHLLAMIAVGLWAALLGGRAQWLVPAAFVAVMLVGGGLAMAAVALPMVETMILTSVVVLGGLVAARLTVPVAAGMAIVAAFALFHGHAHGMEMPVSAGGAQYFAGFLLATAALHAIGLAIGVLARRRHEALPMRAAGGAIAAAGLLLVIGV